MTIKFFIILFTFLYVKIVKLDYIFDPYCRLKVPPLNFPDSLELNQWRIKKAMVRFVTHPSFEHQLYNIRNVIKCNYKIIKFIKNIGIEIHTEIFDANAGNNEDNGYCDPVYVPFNNKYSLDSEILDKPLTKVDHSIVLSIVPDKYLIIYTCFDHPDPSVYEVGAFVFIDENSDVGELYPQVSKVLKDFFGFRVHWIFEDSPGGQCMCEKLNEKREIKNYCYDHNIY